MEMLIDKPYLAKRVGLLILLQVCSCDTFFSFDSVVYCQQDIKVVC